MNPAIARLPKALRVGIPAFILVLLTMPLGHALMVLNEHWLGHRYQLLGAGALGIIGTVLLVWGIRLNNDRSKATLLGLIAGILIWTGWVEFSFVWIAQKLNVPHYVENGEIATKAEYLIMPSSLGLLGSLLLFFILNKTNCTFFRWIQNIAKLKAVKSTATIKKPFAITTMVEVVVITWAFYILLLLIYDNSILGDHHPVTYAVALGSLLWSIVLITKLLTIQKFDYAVRYAVPTVIIFWNFIEIIGRWGLMKEIWIEPIAYWPHMTFTLLCFALFIVYYLRAIRNKTLISQQ